MVLTLVALWLPGLARAQASGEAHLPEWHGSWSGSCSVIGERSQEPFGMRLEVAPIKSSIRLQWRTTYYPEGRDPQVRDQLMIPTVKADHYVVDDQKGIGIDTVRMGNLLYQNFYVHKAGRVMIGRWEHHGDRIEIELPSFSVRPARNTVGEGGEQVSSYGLVGLQRCMLQRD